MGASDFAVSIAGLDEAKAALAGLPNKLRRRALLNALRAGARVVQRAARQRAPLLNLSIPSNVAALRSGRRAVGTLRNAIRVRTSKNAKREGNVGVFINVRPLKSSAIVAFKRATGKSGANNPADPYYWRWVNFGRKASSRRVKRRSGRISRVRTGAYPGVHFLEYGAAQLPEALRQFTLSIGPQIRRLNVNPKDPL